MRLVQIAVQNYKSLHHVRFQPRQLNVLIGANAAGKSNFADCLDFVSEVYKHGLEVAVARKGGYENIAFRRIRRSRRAIAIDLQVELTASDYRAFLGRSESDAPDLLVRHSFSFAASGYSIRAEFRVLEEELIVHRRVPGSDPDLALHLRRSLDEITIVHSQTDRQKVRTFSERSLDFHDLKYFVDQKEAVSSNELFAVAVGRFVRGLRPFVSAMEGIRVFQISPTKSREFGVPTPRPELDRSGANLPAVIDLLRRKNKHEWESVLQAMRNILPELDNILVDYTSSRTLGLFFQESGFGRPWSVGEVSDGTIQTLALLVGIFDARSTALLIEEPENSVHPWIIRHVLDACREAAATKQIIITTHSPIVMNAVPPRDVWVLWRSNGESHLSSVQELDPDFLTLWQSGDIPTFDYIDSGALPKAIPPGPKGESGEGDR
jgi:predicted ATPase